MNVIEKGDLGKDLFKGSFGLEKENIRVNGKGEIARTPHPAVFSEKSENPFITTDFAESQIEIITPPVGSPEEAYNYLDTLQNIISLNLKDEYLWPQSLPPILPEDKDIPIARFLDDDGKTVGKQTEYREKLAEKYGVKKQLISGIHYNFSFDDDFLRILHTKISPHMGYKAFKDNLYMRVIRNMSKMSWMLIRLLGSSPAVDASYADFCTSCSTGAGPDASACGKAASLRNGRCGYRNNIDHIISLDSLNSYIESLEALIEQGELISSKEYYSAIRPKNSKGDLEALTDFGIEYVELRILDINPLFKLGISLRDMKLIHLFFIASLLLEESDVPDMLLDSINNGRAAADTGRNELLELQIDGNVHVATDVSASFFQMLRAMIKKANYEIQAYTEIVEHYEAMNRDPGKLYSAILSGLLADRGFIPFHMDSAKTYLEESRARQFNVTGYEDMELSTQILILDSLQRGVAVDLLDKKENFIKLSKGLKIEYVKQATKTSLDSYSSVLVMENKLITKVILKNAGLNVPKGAVYSSRGDAISGYGRHANKQVVIKPNTTNFGIGITIFVENFTQEEYESAVNLAFDNDGTILIEEFAPGKEYRVFVIGDEVVGVLHRVPANVTGNGVKTIKELIEEKNSNPIRGHGYRRPLEKIRMGMEEEMFLKQQGLSFNSVIEDSTTVYLRENSNISTGGDSVDFTDVISGELKAVAVNSAKAVGANIVGVDLMTTDVTGESSDDYQIIELNFNPAIHIHCFPLVGKNRHLGSKILDILGY